MNTLFSLALPALLALSLVARPAVAAPRALTAAEVMEATAQKYAGFKQFRGTTSILVEGESSIEGEQSQQLVSSANSALEFERGQRLKVTGDSGFGGSFEALSTPDSTTIAVVPKGGEKMPLLQKAALDMEGTTEFLASLTGVSGGGGATLPALLLSKDGDVNPLLATGVLALQSERNLGTKPCYVVTKTDAENKSVSTFWIEKDSFLLRRLETAMGENKSPELTEAMIGAMFTPEQLAQNPALKDVKVPAMTTFYTRHLLVFATQLAK